MARSAALSVIETDKKLSASAETLLDATAALLSQRSTFDVSLSEIAKRSGLNSALIKYYFGNKEGLFLALLERHARQEMDALKHLVEMPISADEKLKIHISGIINAYHRSPYLNRLIHFMIESAQPTSSGRVIEMFIKPMISVYESIINQGVTEGIFRRVDPALLYYSLVGSCDHIFHATYTIEPILHVARITDDLKRRYVAHVREIVLRGLAP